MKNKTISKIMLLALSVAILIGCAFAFSASAEETPVSKGILSQNIVYGDKVAVAFAVDASIENAENVTVNYYWEDAPDVVKKATLLDPSIEANIYKTKDSEGNDITYPVFITEGVAPKELTKVAHATYVAEDGKEYTKSYSAAEYLYVRLYEDGFVNKTEADGLDNNRKLLYQNLLAYGEQAQIVLGYQDKVNLVTNYSFIYSNKAGVSFDGKEYFFGYGEHTVSATYSGKGEPKGWTLTDKDGNTTPYATSTFTVNGVYEVSPVIHECTDTNSDGKCDSCSVYSFSASIDSYGTANGITVNNVGWNGTVTPVEAGNFSHVDTLSSASRPSGFSKGYWFRLANNPTNATDKVIEYSMATTNKDWDANNDHNSDSYLLFTPTEQVADGDLIVFQFDYYQNGGNTGKNPLLYYEVFANDETSIGNKVTYTWNTDIDNDSIKETGVRPAQAGATTSNMTGWVSYQTWFTIRVVYSNTDQKAYYYVSTDGGETFDYLKGISYNVKQDLTKIGFYANYVYQCAATMYIDNVICVKTTEAAFGIKLP